MQTFEKEGASFRNFTQQGANLKNFEAKIRGVITVLGEKLHDFIVVLVFYGPLTHFRSFLVQSVNLSTLFLGKPDLSSLPVLSAYSFASN